MAGGGAQKSVGEEQVSVGFEVSLAPTTCFRSGGTKARNLSFLNRNFFFMHHSPGFPGRDPCPTLPFSKRCATEVASHVPVFTARRILLRRGAAQFAQSGSQMRFARRGKSKRCEGCLR